MSTLFRAYSRTKMTFYYFAYGSNMLSRCLQAITPSAIRVDRGMLNHHRLDFAGYSEQCRGALVTVVPEKNASVYGAIWKIDRTELESLDSMEAPEKGVYRALDQCIERLNGSKLLCRMYQHIQPPHIDHDPQMRWRTLPSMSYLDAIREGSREARLPEEYINFLFNLKDNGRTTSLENMMVVEAQAARKKENLGKTTQSLTF